MSGAVAIIPARGGSKGLARKNVRDVGGRPLIAYTIEAARKARTVGRVIITTDDAEIAEVARRWGGEVPFLRPAALALDETPGIEPIVHAVEWLHAQEGGAPEWATVLQPTSPLRGAEDIDAAFDLACRHDADAVVAVAPLRHHPYWCKALTLDGRLADAIPTDRAYTSRQQLPPMVAIAGAIYLVKTRVLLEQRTLYPERTWGYALPEERALDIDTPWDLRVFEALVRDGAGPR